MTTPEELDRQVAEALGWRWQCHHSSIVRGRLRAVGPDGDIFYDRDCCMYFSPTTDARQWAVLLEMMPDVHLSHSFTWTCWQNGDDRHQHGRAPGEAVVRAFLAWTDVEK